MSDTGEGLTEPLRYFCYKQKCKRISTLGPKSRNSFTVSAFFFLRDKCSALLIYVKKDTAYAVSFFLYQFCNIKNQFFCICPADAGIGDRFSVDTFADLLISAF